MNNLIEKWKENVKKIYESETKLMEYLNLPEEQRTFTYSYLATRQMYLIGERRPDKNKTTEEQLNELQKEMWKYLQKVVETNEL